MHSAWKSVRQCWGQDDSPSPVCEAVSEKVMDISRSVSEESRFAFRSQADVVSEKSRASTPTRNNRQLSKDSASRNTRTMTSRTVSGVHTSSNYDRYSNALSHNRSSEFHPGDEASTDSQQFQAHAGASMHSRVPGEASADNQQVQAQSNNEESRPFSTPSDLNRNTTATGPPGGVASGGNEDTRPSPALLQTALNRRKMQKLKSWRSQQKRTQS